MKLEKNLMIEFLKRFTKNAFTVTIEGKQYQIGEGTSAFHVKFNKMIPLKELASSTSLALGEAYMRGDLEIEGDLYSTLDMFLQEIDNFTLEESALKKILFSSLSKSNQMKEVSYHYDIGNDFYSLWLDETMNYSCAYFKKEDDTLYDAQVHKVEHILEKLYLKEGMTLLDIGCGWGYLLIEAAKKYKIKGTGITLSKEQYKKFKERIEEEHLEEYLRVELLDYRDLSKLHMQFDRIVSVGMLEHVGRENYKTFMNCVNDVLKPRGVFLLHYISGLKENGGDPWICKYIFPGGEIPSLREIIHLLGDMKYHTLDVEDLRMHYNKTLLCWNANFQQHVDEVKTMFDEKFVRMWELYLCSCAAAFHNGSIDIHQIVCTKGVNNELPIVRWY